MKIKTPSYLPVIPDDIVEAYIDSLTEYACEEAICDSDTNVCFCDFINRLQRFDVPVMSREDFYEYTNRTDMTESQSEELYENYVYSWASEQTIDERVELMNTIITSRDDDMYELHILHQNMAKDFMNRAESILNG